LDSLAALVRIKTLLLKLIHDRDAPDGGPMNGLLELAFPLQQANVARPELAPLALNSRLSGSNRASSSGLTSLL